MAKTDNIENKDQLAEKVEKKVDKKTKKSSYSKKKRYSK